MNNKKLLFALICAVELQIFSLKFVFVATKCEYNKNFISVDKNDVQHSSIQWIETDLGKITLMLFIMS